MKFVNVGSIAAEDSRTEKTVGYLKLFDFEQAQCVDEHLLSTFRWLLRLSRFVIVVQTGNVGYAS